MNACPKHGTKFLIKEGNSFYCAAKIPMDKFGLTTCYYTPPQKPGRKKTVICTSCKKRRALKKGSLCRICKNGKQREEYKRNKK